MDANTDTGQWRLTLERRWSRKLDEVLALTAACEGASAAGDDAPDGLATLPAQRLHDRANAALDDLGDLADAIGKIDSGTYGLCEECRTPVPDYWLVRNPAMRLCRECQIDGLLSPASSESPALSRQLAVPSQRAR